MAEKEDLVNLNAMIEQKSVSEDRSRAIVQHSMFAVLFVLLILNWSFYRTPDYEPFIETLDSSAVVERKGFDVIFNALLDAYVREEDNGRADLHQFAWFIKKETDTIVAELEILKLKSAQQKIIDENTIPFSKITALRDSVIRYLGPGYDSNWKPGFPFFNVDIRKRKEIFSLRSNGVQFLPKSYQRSLLYSLEADVLKAENIYINELWYRTHDDGWNFRGFRGAFLPDSFHFIAGEQSKANIFLIQLLDGNKWNNKKKFTVEAGRGIVASDTDAEFCIWTDQAKELGLNRINGTINVRDRELNVTCPFSFSYFVVAPGIALNLEQANTCYLGVPNVLQVHIPSYTADKIKVRVAGASVTKTANGVFNIFCSKMLNGKVYAFVDATNAQGHISTVHSMELNFHELPPPVTNFEAYKKGGIGPEIFRSIRSLELTTADTAFKINYTLNSFRLTCIPKDGHYIEPIEVQGNTSAEMNNLIERAQSGDRFIFSEIKTKGINGRFYEALPVSVLLQ